ncbi:short-chain dehydrogenase [Opitutaceae bacterium EW11]|nr:short-chain dehydrogenase [Opitutaceae bacterium EW11]
MKPSFKPIQHQTIVLTGASSGIGLATARLAVGRGANVVLAARDGQALDSICSELNQGAHLGKALCVAADVSRRDDLQRVADTAIERFGGFDTWVNNAGVSIYGRLEEVSEEDSRQLFETNFWGTVHGSLVAVRHLKQHGGALVNLGSVASDTAIALQGMYSASKHAVKGFTDALRIELDAESVPVSVTLIKPGAIDTPYPQHAKNYLQEEPKHAPPVYTPDEVARAILHAATHAVRDLFIGSSAKAMSAFSRIAPRTMDRVAGPMMMRQQKRYERARNPSGTLREPGFGGRERGDQPGHVMRRSFYTEASMHPALTAGLLAAGGVGAFAVVRTLQRRAASSRMRDFSKA